VALGKNRYLYLQLAERLKMPPVEQRLGQTARHPERFPLRSGRYQYLALTVMMVSVGLMETPDLLVAVVSQASALLDRLPVVHLTDLLEPYYRGQSLLVQSWL
jgi:hypothetical protein